MPDTKTINDFLRKHIDPMSRAYVHPYRPATLPGFTKATRRTTAEICLWLVDNGLWFACEVRIIGRTRRADILCPELCESQVIEIYDSESMESIAAKNLDYKKARVTMLAVPAEHKTAIKMIADANGVPT